MCMEGGGWQWGSEGTGTLWKVPEFWLCDWAVGLLAQSSHGASPLAIGPIEAFDFLSSSCPKDTKWPLNGGFN